MTMPDLRELDRRAVLHSVDLVDAVRPGHLDIATPCRGWTLRDLLAHCVAQHHGFAAAAEGRTDPDEWRLRELGADPAASYRAAAQRVLTAFAADGVLDRDFWLPEVKAGGHFPARQAISFHLVDYVVHGWDVAAALGIPVGFDDEVVGAALAVAKAEVPDGPNRHRPGATFAPPVGGGPAEGALDDLLTYLGRDPRWRP
jgi:uncharacterized protein (TIGR03086 family)